MQRTAEFHHGIPDTLLLQADPVLDDTTALDTTTDMLDPEPAMGECLIGHMLLQRQFLAAQFLGRHEDCDLRQCERQETQILQELAPPGKGYGVASAIRLSCTRPPYVALRKRSVRRALTS